MVIAALELVHSRSEAGDPIPGRLQPRPNSYNRSQSCGFPPPRDPSRDPDRAPHSPRPCRRRLQPPESGRSSHRLQAPFVTPAWPLRVANRQLQPVAVRWIPGSCRAPERPPRPRTDRPLPPTLSPLTPPYASIHPSLPPPAGHPWSVTYTPTTPKPLSRT